MPAGPIGSVWGLLTWPDTVWEVDTWATLVPPVVVPTSAGMLNLGSASVLGEDIVYTLPSKMVRIMVYTLAGTVQISIDAITWTDAALNANKEFNTSARFIKCIDDNAVITVKQIKRVSIL